MKKTIERLYYSLAVMSIITYLTITSLNKEQLLLICFFLAFIYIVITIRSIFENYNNSLDMLLSGAVMILMLLMLSEKVIYEVKSYKIDAFKIENFSKTEFIVDVYYDKNKTIKSKIYKKTKLDTLINDLTSKKECTVELNKDKFKNILCENTNIYGKRIQR
jgi:hypothetical protein